MYSEEVFSGETGKKGTNFEKQLVPRACRDETWVRGSFSRIAVFLHVQTG